ncbi:MAG: UDP-N-acetylmuramoyl-L-alanine--D-glutamate ligase [Ruminococcaceae bacterium]|nr:UDP-N-acetylmuramoyl-L-alanine--D-glutamate ligase [Oscillospiraceae bacterium]
MNTNFELFRATMLGKRVSVVGLGVSNRPLLKFLTDMGALVTGCDKRETFDEKTMQYMQDNTVCLHLGEDYLDHFDKCDFIIKTPGLRRDLPQFRAAQQAGIPITSEMELFLNLCPAPIIAVTGSDGKTTTTTLIHRILTQSGYSCYVGGNIGTPLLTEVPNMCPDHRVVLELSSFQLHDMHISPQTAVITNVSPNHLDWHVDYDEYIDAKKQIFRYQGRDGLLIVNADNSVTAPMAKETPGQARVFSSSGGNRLGAHLSGDMLCYGETPIVRRQDIVIRGMHNVENYLAAISAVWDLVDVEDIVKVATTFTGVEHRMERVRIKDGITFYNDSIASSPSRTMAGLQAFDQKVILIAGGYDKKIPYDVMAPVLREKVKGLVLLGATADKIFDAARSAYGEGEQTMPITRCEDLESAVKEAYAMAGDGDAVVLSPASASFDMFTNFEERGNLFKQIVNAL